MSHSKRTKPFLGVVLAATLALTAACGGNSDDSDDKGSEASSAQGDQSQAPGLEDVPDVVAEVNGEEVTKDEFTATYEMALQQATQQSQMTGEQPDEDAIKKQTADQLVDTELLVQEAENREISATDEDVDKRLEGLAEQNQMGSVDEFLKALEQQGTTEDYAREQIRIQVLIEGLVNDEAGPIKPSDAELRKIYDQAVKQQKAAAQKGGQEQKIPSFAKARPQLVQQAKTTEQGKTARDLVTSLRKDAEITVNL
ncbi:hypothetical protein ncot_00055 [Nocardioides sp. JQ2195]|uniref:SurA N-terminal domain-containing protein n=1 Tax=Nocardioides sp. JQ2195 TaxID=2592334 RepID=UPI00143E1C75|nr:SurA N-terminal domain-containing protein [Nocardioides sp. JQ2195]QIX25154.1 hypothetical protein ncot_00055 [Nocardioides sp. JQ2195]